MARIALIKMFFGMTLSAAQLAGELKAHGHKPLVINFKKQEMVPFKQRENPKYRIGDVPAPGFTINKNGARYYEVAIWNKMNEFERDSLLQVLRDFEPDAIGITNLSLSVSFSNEIAGMLKRHFNVPILSGGTGPTLEPEKSIDNADLVCVGEGEEVIIEIAERLDRGETLEGIPGTWFRLPNGEIQKNPKRPVSDLEKIAMPSWDKDHTLWINEDRIIDHFLPEEWMADKSYKIMTQRGCPFSCSFCVESFYQREFGKKDSLRRMSPEKAIEELKYAKDVMGFKSITFFDDVFTINPRWLDEFLPLYKKEIDLPFFCYTYPTTHNPKLLTKLKDAGCHAMTMGVQSGSDRILHEIYERPTKYNRIVEAAEEIVASGIPAATFDMIPMTKWDTEEDLRKTFELLLRMPKEMDTTFYAELALYPKFPIMEKLEDEDLLAKSESLSRHTYIYYLKMYNLTRTQLPVEKIREIYDDPKYREDHTLLNPMLNDDQTMAPQYGTLIDLGVEREKAKRESLKKTS